MKGAPAKREALRARRRQLRAQLRRRQPPRRRWPWVLLALLLVLLALLQDCSCTEPPSEEPGAGLAPAGLVGEAIAPEAPITGRIDRMDRPGFRTETPEALPWLASFRLQVAARAPRLAECFVGVPRPGALRWTASVESGSGRVSDHTLEPILASEALTAEQRACVIGVLSDPPYPIDAPDDRSTPSRIGMAIEF